MAEKAQVHLDERWDKLLELSLRRVTYGAAAGGLAGLLLLRGYGNGGGPDGAMRSSEWESPVPCCMTG